MSKTKEALKKFKLKLRRMLAEVNEDIDGLEDVEALEVETPEADELEKPKVRKKVKKKVKRISKRVDENGNPKDNDDDTTEEEENFFLV